MSDFYMVNSNMGASQKILLLNQMIVELAGLVTDAQFDKNELDSIYANSTMSRKYARRVGLGNTLTTYNGWTSVSVQQGYNVWQYTPPNYAYNSLNQVYLNGQAFTNRGLAFATQPTVFNYAALFEADSHPGYVNEVNAGNTTLNTSFYLMASTSDYLYLGSSSTFGGVTFNFKSRGANYNLVVQYWTGTAWVTLGPANGYSDDTNGFQSSGPITWNVPLNWNTTTVNSQGPYYYIRISTTTNPVVIGQAYYAIPSTSAVALLALSSSDITAQNWCWCSYNGSIYVTLPNVGGFGQDGINYIISGDTATNLQNFFVYNNPITADYQTTTYNPVEQITTSTYTITSLDSIMLVYATQPTTLTLPSAVGVEGEQYTVKHAGGASNVTLQGSSGNRIDGSASYTLNAALSFVTVVSDGENWYIINAGTA